MVRPIERAQQLVKLRKAADNPSHPFALVFDTDLYLIKSHFRALSRLSTNQPTEHEHETKIVYFNFDCGAFVRAQSDAREKKRLVTVFNGNQSGG